MTDLGGSMYTWLASNVLFRAHEQLKGHPTYRILRDGEAADRLSASELNELQASKLRELLGYCYVHVPYVKSMLDQARVKVSDIRGALDLQCLPLLSKADIRKNREQLRSREARNLRSFTTGGSTGEPLIFDLGKLRIGSQVANRQRVYRWWDVPVGTREFALWGSPIELTRQDRIKGFRDRLLRTRLFPAFNMNEAVMSEYLDALGRHPWRQIFAYPSALYQLCLLARKQGRNLRTLGIKVVFVTSEMLFPYQRELIADTFNCPVGNGYGGRDSGFIAHECPQGGMHIIADSVIVETVRPDGRPTRPGEVGDIVVTDLYSQEAPFIRYITGDVGVVSDRRCPCGRALPLFDRIDGRSNDVILTPDGRIMNALGVVYPLRELAGIEQFRICQKELDRFHIQLVTNGDFHPESENILLRKWEQLMNCPLHVTFEYLSDLSRENTGKFRHVISELPTAQVGRSGDGPLIRGSSNNSQKRPLELGRLRRLGPDWLLFITLHRAPAGRQRIRRLDAGRVVDRLLRHVDLGLRQSVGRYVSRYVGLDEPAEVNRTISTAVSMLTGGGVFALVVTLLLRANFHTLFTIEPHFEHAARAALLIAGCNIALALPLSVFSTVLWAVERFDIVTGISICGALLRAGLVISALRSGAGIADLALITLLVSVSEYAATILCAKALYKPLRIGPTWVGMARARELFGFGIYRFVWVVSNQLIFYTDSMVIGHYLGAGAITPYAIAGSLINYARNIVSLSSDAFYPIASRLDGKKDLTGLRDLLIVSTKLALTIGLPLCVGLIFLSRQFVTLWMGEAYASSALFVAILTIPQFTSMSQYSSTLILVGMAKHRTLAYIALAEGVANLILSVILVQKWDYWV